MVSCLQEPARWTDSQVLLGVVNRKANLETWWEDEDMEIEDQQVYCVLHDRCADIFGHTADANSRVEPIDSHGVRDSRGSLIPC